MNLLTGCVVMKKISSKFWLYCARPTKGGINLIKALNGRRIRRNRPRPFLLRRNRIVINWGSTLEYDNFRGMGVILNNPNHVDIMVNKLAFMDYIGQENYLPDYTTDKKVAREWAKKGATVVCRTILNGHSGAGIVIAKSSKGIVDAPLYTRYIPKDEEYRVHCVRTDKGCDVFYVQKKVKRKDFEGKHNRLVRNHTNGYTYQHSNVELPAAVLNAAECVFNRTGLDFGAVDVIYCKNKKDEGKFDSVDKAYVLEINTAPGLEGESVKAYSDMFKKYF